MKRAICTRLLAMLLAVTMIAGMIPVTGYAAETEPAATQESFSDTTVPKETQDETVEPEITESETTEPEVTEPEATEPVVTEPETSEPVVTEPETTEPVATEPEVTEPEGLFANEPVTYAGPTGKGVDYDDTVDQYYNVISKKDWELAPGIHESEIVLNNADGTQRQVLHVVSADVDNEYVKVMPSYGGMKEALDSKDYKVQIMSEQTAWAESNGYGNIVASMNLSLSWYTDAYYGEHPELIGEPLGYLIMDGKYYENSQGKTAGAQTCVVINFNEKDGVVRPAAMPRVEIRSTSEAITGWEEQVIPANFGYLVKDGKNLYSEDNNVANGASRSFVGVTYDGKFVMVMNDGRQSPYSAGLTSYEMGEVMRSLGCVVAVNGDGGGSSTFLSQRPGEEMKLNCSPSDGAERPTTHGIFVITTAPATGEFVRANISTENEYFTPGSTVEFTAVGTDLVGTEAPIPAEATWQIQEANMGTIENGVFVSNGTVGTATAQLIYQNNVVGEKSINIVIPDAFRFQQSTMTVPYGKEVNISMIATVDKGLHEVVLKEDDITFSLDNPALGTINGFQFLSAEETAAPEMPAGILSAELKCAGITATITVVLGKGSEIIEDFETGMDWGCGNFKDYDGVVVEMEHVTAENGKVHDGTGAASFHVNALSSEHISNGSHNQMGIYLSHSRIIKNAKRIGIWAYLPDDYYNTGLYITYFYDPDGDGIYDKRNAGVALADQPYVYNNLEESGWHYFSTDVSAYDSILLNGPDIAESLTGYNPARGDGMNFRFLEIRSTHANANALYKDLGGLNGPFTIYLDSLTVDYSDAVEDREPPVFGDVTLRTTTEAEYSLLKRTPVTTTGNMLNVVANVTENSEKANAAGLNEHSAKAYVDGVQVPVHYANNRLSISNIAVADGEHRVKFEICDHAGNKATVVRHVNVRSGANPAAIQVVPKDPTLDRLYGGSVYWMDIKAAEIEAIQSIKTVIDINNVNHWELDHMEVAPGFTASYSVDPVTNTASITITRTGKSDQAGAAVLASLPIRIVYFDTDIRMANYTAETYWKTFPFWAQDLTVDVDLGEITYVDGYTNDVLNSFSNGAFVVDSELYISSDKMDQAFKAARGTCHVHTAVALEDKAATCTEKGYVNRTYCNVCQSVVAWGNGVASAGHTYKLVDGQFVCDCGEQFVLSTGLNEVNGKHYYAIGGELVSGWQLVDEDYYYFDTTTYTTVESYNNGCVTFAFEEDGKLISGQWYTTAAGTQYYYGPSFHVRKWATIDGKKYAFDKKGYRYEGLCYLGDGLANAAVPSLYKFDDNGVYLGLYDEDYTGVVACSRGEYCYLINDTLAQGAGLIKDGQDYYYVRSGGNVAIGTYFVYNTNGLVERGNYEFAADGKMLNPPVTEEPVVKNGLVSENGGIYYYIDNVLQTGAGLVKIGEDYYYVRSGGNVATGAYYVYNTNGLVVRGTYEFGADGKMLVPPVEEVPVDKNGLVSENGGIYYYVDNVLQTGAGLVKIGEDYYYVRSGGNVATGTYFVYNTNGLVARGDYAFADDGKMLIPPVEEEPVVKNGLVSENGGVYYYVDNVLQAGAGLVKIGEDYYYVRSGGNVATGAYFVYNTNNLVVRGTYEFAADGKMLHPPVVEEPVVKDGLVSENGGIYYYISNELQTAAGLVKIGEDYYYVRSGGNVAIGTYFVYNTNGLVARGNYEFGADGKLLDPSVVVK